MRYPPLLLLAAALTAGGPTLADDALCLRLEGAEGPGAGKTVVLVTGDEEYRSEEALTQLARILATHHGFDCTVLYAIDPESGTIDPNNQQNIPGLEALADADLMVLFTRFRNLPDDQMRHIVAYLDAGKPIVALRTSTHAFNNPADSTFAKYGWQSQAEGWEGGFGKRILGETWVAHHGQHGVQSTRGIIAEGQADHPILRGIEDGDIFGPSDVYAVRLPLPGDTQPLVLGQVLEGMSPEDAPVRGSQNDPMMPVAWIKSYEADSGATGQVFTTTMGASEDLLSEGLRRLLVNACYWATGLEDQIPAESKVDLVGDYDPLPFKFGGFQPGVKPADLAGP